MKRPTPEAEFQDQKADELLKLLFPATHEQDILAEFKAQLEMGSANLIRSAVRHHQAKRHDYSLKLASLQELEVVDEPILNPDDFKWEHGEHTIAAIYHGRKYCLDILKITAAPESQQSLVGAFALIDKPDITVDTPTLLATKSFTPFVRLEDAIGRRLNLIKSWLRRPGAVIFDGGAYDHQTLMAQLNYCWFYDIQLTPSQTVQVMAGAVADSLGTGYAVHIRHGLKKLVVYRYQP